MGRQQFLTRMALGRSAFEDVNEDSAEVSLPSPTASQEKHVEDQTSGVYVQKYDAKGRPFNPAIDHFNAEMRAAQNEALELVGVVERKDHSDRLKELRRKYREQTRVTLIKAEHERGELLDFVLTPVRFLSRCWVEAFVHRVQIGFYDPARPMADILLSEWRVRWTGGFKNSLATRFPAMGDLVAHALIRIPLTVGVEQITSRLQNMLKKGRLSRDTKAELLYSISMAFEVLLWAIDAALLPIEYYAFAQRMGLAPPLPLLPPLKFCLPGNPESFHSFGWKPLASFALIKIICSPASLLLWYKIFHFDEDAEDAPICAFFTSYRYPNINALPGDPYNPLMLQRHATTDPFGWLLQQGWLLRTRFLQWCGWKIFDEQTSQAHPIHEDNTTLMTRPLPLPGRSYEPRQEIYRSTHLAHMPAQHLAQAIDKLYCHIIVLPFESLMLRTIAATYMASPLTAKTPQAVEASSRLFRPFGSNPLDMLLRSPTDVSAWSSLGTYLSRLSLAMALSSSVDTILYFGVYACTRHIGLKFFDWGRRDQIGGAGLIFDNIHSHSVTIEDSHSHSREAAPP